jgi:hypothetical protein
MIAMNINLNTCRQLNRLLAIFQSALLLFPSIFTPLGDVSIKLIIDIFNQNSSGAIKDVFFINSLKIRPPTLFRLKALSLL